MNGSQLEEEFAIYKLFEQIERFLDTAISESSATGNLGLVAKIANYAFVSFLKMAFYFLTLTVFPQLVFHLFLRLFSMAILCLYCVTYFFRCLDSAFSIFLDRTIVGTGYFIKNIYKTRRFHRWGVFHYFSLLANFVWGILLFWIPDYLFSRLYRRVVRERIQFQPHGRDNRMVFTVISLAITLISTDLIRYLFLGISIYWAILVGVLVALCMVAIYNDLASDEKSDFAIHGDPFGFKRAIFDLFALFNGFIWDD